MTREDINDIINAICPNDEDYEKPCISPKYLRQELEQLALDQKQWNGEPITKNNLAVDKLLSDCEKMSFDIEIFNKPLKVVALDAVKNIVNDLPSVTPQEPKIVTIAEIKYDKDKLKELMNKAVLTVIPQEPRWIPVSERLPEDHKDVFVYLSSDRISICRYNSHKLPFSDNPIGWSYLYGNAFIDFTKEHVIAWMPLPKPYKAESEG